jgi:hypothetical protein
MTFKKTVISLLLLCSLVFSLAAGIVPGYAANDSAYADDAQVHADDKSIYAADSDFPVEVLAVVVDPVEAFVLRLYHYAVGRTDPTQGEVDNWKNVLLSGGTGASVANSFFTSSTFLNQRVSDSEYVTRLYRALIGRDPVAGEVENWAGQLAAGMPREEVFAAFINSASFADVCSEAGITRGTYTPPPGGRARTFVTRLYRYVVLRNDPSVAEVNNWTNNLLTGGGTGASVANAFFTSSTFLNQRVSNEDYVTRLYMALIGRDPFPGEVENWAGQLAAGLPREDVFAAFINSASFAIMCREAGITRGTFTPPAGGRTRAFVTRLYRDVIGRHDPTPGEIDHWTNVLLNGGGTGASVASAFFNSSTFINQRVSDSEYVTRLYTALMGRAPLAGEVEHWVEQLEMGLPREDVFAACINSDSFAEMCRAANITRGTFTPPPGGQTRVFVSSLFRGTLGRNPSTSDLNNWANMLMSGESTGAELAYRLLFSDEFERLGHSDEQFVRILYNTLIGWVDESGVTRWINTLRAGESRYNAFVSFVASNEFEWICRSHGVTRGDPPPPRNMMQGTTNVAKVWNLIASEHFRGISDRPEHIAGIIGNLQSEAGPALCPFQIQVSNHVGLGLMQWSFGRRTDLENYMWRNGISQEEFETEMNKHLNSYVCPPGNHPQEFLDRVLAVQIDFMFHELRNTWERFYLNFIDYPTHTTGVAGARAYAELFCVLALRPGPGTGEINDIVDLGVQEALRESLFGGAGNLDRISYSALGIRRDRAETVFRQFQAGHR